MQNHRIALSGNLVRRACLLLALSHFSAAHADVVFTLGNNPQPDEENILLTANDTGTTISGTTNQTLAEIEFTSTQTLVVSASGTAISGDNVPLTNISIALTGGGTFGDFILNPAISSTACSGCAGGIANVSVSALLDGTFENTFTFSYALGNGLNFVTITTSNGESIGSISLTAANGFTALSQSRISGVAASVPEPATVALLGIGLAGVALARRCVRLSG